MVPSNRGKNVSKEQKEIMVTMMEDDIDLANDRFRGIDGKSANRESWEQLAVRLNGIGGAYKNGDKWKRAWTDMKKYARTQWSDLKEYDNRTGLGLECSSRRPAELHAIDQRIINIISPESCAGNFNNEGGMRMSTQSATPRTTDEPTAMDLPRTADVPCSNDLPRTADTPTFTDSPRMGDVLESVRPTRSKHIRGSAYTRDSLIREANKIEKEKADALKRIAIAQERRAAAMEKRNEILERFLMSKNNNQNVNPLQVQYSGQYEEVEYLLED